MLWSTIDPATGKRRQHRKRGFTRKTPAKPPAGDSAREFLNSTVGAVTNGTWKPDNNLLTVQTLVVTHWLPARRLQGLRPATMSLYERATRDWVLPHLGGQRVASLRPAHVTKLVETLRTIKSKKGKDGISPRSIQMAVGCLTAATKWATKTELIGRDPLLGVDRPRATNPTMTAWSTDEARAFLTATRGDALGWAWAIMVTRGLRRGEVCGLRWQNIDLEAGTLQVVEALVVVTGKPVHSTPKTAAARRTVPLDDKLVALLKAHRAHQATERLAAGESYDDRGYVFADELGRPHHPTTITRWFRRAVKASGVRRVRLHDNRHTCATLLLADAVPVKVVSELLGHASTAVTLAVYSHTLPSMAEDAGAALSDALLA